MPQNGLHEAAEWGLGYRNGMREAAEAMRALRGFIGTAQARVMADGCRGEERQFFFDKLVEMAGIVAAMPKTYEQDGKGTAAIVSLHYFTGACDWHITEKDVDTDGEGQVQAFGYANLGYGRELGYICLPEILEAGAELDLHFTPRTVAEVFGKRKDNGPAFHEADCGGVFDGVNTVSSDADPGL